jgi:enoyl reductase
VRAAGVQSFVDYASAAKFGIQILGGDGSAAILSELADLHERGKLRIHIHQAVPFAAAADAHREIETGHVRGRVVLTVE